MKSLYEIFGNSFYRVNNGHPDVYSVLLLKILRREFTVSASGSVVQIAPQTGRFCGAKRTRSGASGHLNLMI